MFGETNIYYRKIWNHPIETTVSKCSWHVWGIIVILVSDPNTGFECGRFFFSRKDRPFACKNFMFHPLQPNMPPGAGIFHVYSHTCQSYLAHLGVLSITHFLIFPSDISSLRFFASNFKAQILQFDSFEVGFCNLVDPLKVPDLFWFPAKNNGKYPMDILVSYPNYSYTMRIRIPNDMGMV